ncbi:MAG TPA: ATP-binding protein [Nocardioides sp.]
MVEDASTILHELVRNGIDHGSPCEDHTLEVRWTVADDVLTLRVTDCGTPNGACPPECGTDCGTADHVERWRSKILAPVAPDALRGRGLHLVDALSESWDVATGAGRTTVSARVRLR